MKIQNQNPEKNYKEFATDIFYGLPDMPGYDMILRETPFAWKQDNIGAPQRMFIDVLNKATDREISIDLQGYYVLYTRNEKSREDIINMAHAYIDTCLQGDLKIAKELNKLPEKSDTEEEFER